MAYRDYSTAYGRIVDPNGHGDFTTIAAALTASASGQQIFIKSGTYTENLTLKVGVNLVGFNGDGDTPEVTIIGKATLTAAGTVTISNIRLQTNSDFFLAVTGSAASIVNLNNCYLNCSNNSGISFTTSEATAVINISYCKGNLGTTGIGLYADSSAGTINVNWTHITNTGLSVTATSNSAGTNIYRGSHVRYPISTTSTGGINFYDGGSIDLPTNATALTINGSNSCNAFYLWLNSGTSSAVSIGTGSTCNFYGCTVGSNNTNAITGLGTFSSQDLMFNGSSRTINTTITQGGTLFGNTTIAPSPGFLGEQIRAANTFGTHIALTSGVPANVNSIVLSAGIWDVSCLTVLDGNPTINGNTITSIVTTSATDGTGGDNCAFFAGFPTAAFGVSATVPTYRLTLTAATTTVYQTANAIFGLGACNAYGRISGTRVG